MTEESIKQQVKEARGWSYWAQAIDQEREVLALCDTVETLLRALQLAVSEVGGVNGTTCDCEDCKRDLDTRLESAQRIEEAK